MKKFGAESRYDMLTSVTWTLQIFAFLNSLTFKNVELQDSNHNNYNTKEFKLRILYWKCENMCCILILTCNKNIWSTALCIIHDVQCGTDCMAIEVITGQVAGKLEPWLSGAR